MRITPPYVTWCHCGHLLECCADCREWLKANRARLEETMNAWLWWWESHPDAPSGGWVKDTDLTNAAEANDLGVYLARRFYNA